MELAHAVDNRVDRVYANPNSEWKTKTILQSLIATENQSLGY
jgi:hypothetical protein